MTNFEKVGLFMSTFGQEVKTRPSLSSEKINNLRISLIKEELEEFKQAIKNNDLQSEEELKGVIDLYKTSNPDYEQEKDMLQSILQLNDITVEEIFTFFATGGSKKSENFDEKHQNMAKNGLKSSFLPIKCFG